MKIGIIGAGHIGGTVARLFVRAGHDIAVSNSRGPQSLQAMLDELGPRAEALTINDAARFGDVVFLAVPWRSPKALPAAGIIAQKIVIDAMNPYSVAGDVIDLGDITSSEEVLRRLPQTRLVKAFNTMYYQDLAQRGNPGLPIEDRYAMFLAGDNGEAKRVVSGLIEDIGFGPVDTGSLHEGGRFQQPGSPIYNHLMTVREAQRILARMPRAAGQ